MNVVRYEMICNCIAARDSLDRQVVTENLVFLLGPKLENSEKLELALHNLSLTRIVGIFTQDVA